MCNAKFDTLLEAFLRALESTKSDAEKEGFIYDDQSLFVKLIEKVRKEVKEETNSAKSTKFDMSQCKNGDRLRTRDGREAWYIGLDCFGQHTVQVWGKEITILTYGKSGVYGRHQNNIDIIGFASPIPKIVKCEAWVNLYKNGYAIHGSRKEADECSGSRLECRRIEWQYEDNN